MFKQKLSPHARHAQSVGVSTPCRAEHVNFGGGCLNCGYGEIDKKPKPKPKKIKEETQLGEIMNTRKIIDYAFADEGSKLRETLYASIHDKVMAHIEAKKQEVAKGLVASEEFLPEVDDETEILDEKTRAAKEAEKKTGARTNKPVGGASREIMQADRASSQRVSRDTTSGPKGKLPA